MLKLIFLLSVLLFICAVHGQETCGDDDDCVEWNLKVLTNKNGELKIVTGAASTDGNGNQTMTGIGASVENRNLLKMPLVHREKYTRGYLLEIYDYDAVFCASPFNTAGVNLWGGFTKGFFYLLGLIYMFLGVSIVADVFMMAIEVITSQQKSIKRTIQMKDGTKKEIEIKVSFWNETVANLTLLALGSSAPEILLAVLETVTSLGEPASELGPSTIVGSASFNLFMITAICCISVPEGEERRINQLGVFYITAFASVFAYLWLLICIIGPSYEQVDLWEGFLTFCFFPILVGVAYAQDVNLFCANDNEPKRMKIAVGLKDQVARRLTEVGHIGKHKDAVKEHLQKVEKDLLQRKSPLWWRINGARVMAGKKPLIKPGDKIEAFVDGITEDDYKQTKRKEHGDIYVTFKAPTFSVREDEGSIKLPVYREGDLSGATSVHFETLSGTADANEDFEYRSAYLTFQPNERVQYIEVPIVQDDIPEDNEYFTVVLSDARQKGTTVTIDQKVATVIIIDVSDPGEFCFEKKVMHISEKEDFVTVMVQREGGSTGDIIVDWTSRQQSAFPGDDYGEVGVFEELAGELVFENGVSELPIEIAIVDNNRYDPEEKSFEIALLSANNKGMIKKGGNEIVIGISEDELYSKVIQEALALIGDGHDLTTHGWREQFNDALEFDPDSTNFALILHTLSVPWKFLFACLPPTSYYGGKATFGTSLAAIGLVTYVIGDMATMFGCMAGIPTSIVAITIVALGTSMPDTFASITATQMSSSADAAIGNITGSNAVNVFLGLGLPWLIASIYAEFDGKPYVVPAGSLATSVAVFVPMATTVLGLLIYREWVGWGALGGTPTGRKQMAAFFTLLWFVFIFIAVLKSQGVIAGI